MHLMFLLGRRTGQVLEASIENGNPEDRHTVALHKPGEGETLRHMPREISNVTWFFLRQEGSNSCEITGRRRRSVVPGKGLEVSMYAFTGKPATLIKATTTPKDSLITITPLPVMI